MASIVVKGLTKAYGNFKALDDVSFEVEEGEIFSLLGPNGAGKTTTIKVLTTLTPPTGGEAYVAGFNVVRQPNKVRERISWLSAEVILDDDLTAMENLKIQASLQGLSDWKDRARALLDYFDLTNFTNQRVGKFSTGMRKKLEIAMALLNSPEVIFIDEPTIGLDVATRRMLWDLIRNVNKKYSVTVFLTTHYMEEADQLCHRIAIINRGKIVAVGTPAELKAKAGGTVVVFELSQGFDGENLKGVKGVLESQLKDGTLSVTLDDESHVVDLLRAIDLKKVKSVKILKPSLDTAFLKLTGSTIEEAEVDYRKFYAMIRRATR